jgi:hypothetical protein
MWISFWFTYAPVGTALLPGVIITSRLIRIKLTSTLLRSICVAFLAASGNTDLGFVRSSIGVCYDVAGAI